MREISFSDRVVKFYGPMSILNKTQIIVISFWYGAIMYGTKYRPNEHRDLAAHLHPVLQNLHAIIYVY